MGVSASEDEDSPEVIDVETYTLGPIAMKTELAGVGVDEEMIDDDDYL